MIYLNIYEKIDESVMTNERCEFIRNYQTSYNLLKEKKYCFLGWLINKWTILKRFVKQNKKKLIDSCSCDQP